MKYITLISFLTNSLNGSFLGLPNCEKDSECKTKKKEIATILTDHADKMKFSF